MSNKYEAVIFDKPYSPEKIREGIGVNRAFAAGDCDRCQHLAQCENDRSFKFPQDAACVKYTAALRNQKGDQI